jgi:hypothetical protein
MAMAEQPIADLEEVHANADRRRDAMPGEHRHLRLTGDILVVFDEHDDGERAPTGRPTGYADAGSRYTLGAYTWPCQLARSVSPA